MIEFGFNKFDEITVTVFQSSTETILQPVWHLNEEKKPAQFHSTGTGEGRSP